MTKRLFFLHIQCEYSGNTLFTIENDIILNQTVLLLGPPPASSFDVRADEKKMNYGRMQPWIHASINLFQHQILLSLVLTLPFPLKDLETKLVGLLQKL